MKDDKGSSTKSLVSWCLFDFANSPFTTLVVTFIFATYFTKSIAADEVRGTVLWSRGVTITALVVALLSPIMGALADRGGYRKFFLICTTATCLIGTTLMFGTGPGEVTMALVYFVVANIAFEMGNVFYNAFLPDITGPENVGRISGYGWALGYLGGLLALVIALVGFVQPEQPWFGFTTEGGENIRATNLLVACWFLIFSLPLFLWVKDRSQPTPLGGSIVGDSFKQLGRTFKEIRHYRQILWFLLARLVYNDGLITVFAFGGIYAAGTFGFEIEEILIFGIVLNLTAGLGAFGMGFLDDKLGGKRTLQISLIGLAAATLLAVTAPNRAWFWVAGITVGIFSGPNQSASRSLMARFVPAEKENEFFGFFAFSGKATAFLGPTLLGIITQVSGSQRIGISVVLVLFAIGLLLLGKVNEKEGIEAANQPFPADT